MEQSDLLRYVAEVFERLGLRYFVTGSTASIFYGEPRLTNDIDVVLDLPPDRVGALLAAFPPQDFYFSADAARAAVAQRSQFNIIHPESGLKVDVMIAKDTPFDHSRLARAARLRLGPDYEATFASPEDVIIKKMEFFREGGSEKHLRDIASMLKISGSQIDCTYIARWAHDLGLDEIWMTIQEKAK
jgi:hypothetical protein